MDKKQRLTELWFADEQRQDDLRVRGIASRKSKNYYHLPKVHALLE
jgi:hypothetical protein